MSSEHSAEQNQEAFEYVTGLLRGNERVQFEKRLSKEPELTQLVTTWEHRLFVLQDTEASITVPSWLWTSINQKINPVTETKKQAWYQVTWIPWAFASLFFLVSFFAVMWQKIPLESKAPIDYVAVLTDKSGEAKLTAMTTGSDQTMWLSWQDVQLSSEHSLQIWAISKSDHQVRSIAILNDTTTNSFTLSDAHWRLIKDAQSLILTLEDLGGSPIDEPSEHQIARGVCVRVSG